MDQYVPPSLNISRSSSPHHAAPRVSVNHSRLILPPLFIYRVALKKLISELPSMTEQELAAAGELGTSHTHRLSISSRFTSMNPFCSLGSFEIHL